MNTMQRAKEILQVYDNREFYDRGVRVYVPYQKGAFTHIMLTLRHRIDSIVKGYYVSATPCFVEPRDEFGSMVRFSPMDTITMFEEQASRMDKNRFRNFVPKEHPQTLLLVNELVKNIENGGTTWTQS